MTNEAEERARRPRIYAASRASVPERPAMWQKLRSEGASIVSSWIDEAAPGASADISELWVRIAREIASADRLVLYVEEGDFPLKGALVEVGMALGMGKEVWIVAPGVELEPRSFRPLGSWAKHPNCHFCTSMYDATRCSNFVAARAASPVSAPTVADTWDKATRLAEQFADASESGVGRTVGLAIAAECRRRSNAVAPVSAKCEMCGSEDRAIRLCEIPWAGGQAHEPIEGEDCILCSSDWHAAAPSVASENSATQPSKSPDYEVCTNQNGHPKWCKCGSEDWMRKAAEDLAAELRRRCNTKMSLLHQSAWYEAANELEKFAETIIAKHYAASHLSTEKKI